MINNLIRQLGLNSYLHPHTNTFKHTHARTHMYMHRTTQSQTHANTNTHTHIQTLEQKIHSRKNKRIDNVYLFKHTNPAKTYLYQKQNWIWRQWIVYNELITWCVHSHINLRTHIHSNSNTHKRIHKCVYISTLTNTPTLKNTHKHKPTHKQTHNT